MPGLESQVDQRFQNLQFLHDFLIEDVNKYLKKPESEVTFLGIDSCLDRCSSRIKLVETSKLDTFEDLANHPRLEEMIKSLNETIIRLKSIRKNLNK